MAVVLVPEGISVIQIPTRGERKNHWGEGGGSNYVEKKVAKGWQLYLYRGTFQ